MRDQAAAARWRDRDGCIVLIPAATHPRGRLISTIVEQGVLKTLYSIRSRYAADRCLHIRSSSAPLVRGRRANQATSTINYRPARGV